MRLHMELTVVSTFAGCGGSSLGYKWAGFRELLAIDNNANACQFLIFIMVIPLKLLEYKYTISRLTY